MVQVSQVYNNREKSNVLSVGEGRKSKKNVIFVLLSAWSTWRFLGVGDKLFKYVWIGERAVLVVKVFLRGQ